MSIDVNGAGAADSDAAAWNVTDAAPGTTACIKALSNNGSNTITAKYRSEGVLTATFADRWLIALKYSNL
jgi:hypothetical protein